MNEEYSMSLRIATRDAAKLRDDRNVNTIYGARPQNNPLEDNQKGGEEVLPERIGLLESFGFRIGVDKYGWGEWEGEVPNVRG